ncbi:MAG: hypothetical protein Q4D55_03640 [Eubacteriales bacterium]|nr:hypothetical protein [Eubacteriales bacterium]
MGLLLSILLIFFLLQTIVLFCCAAAGNDPLSQSISDEEQIAFLEAWRKKHPLKKDGNG